MATNDEIDAVYMEMDDLLSCGKYTEANEVLRQTELGLDTDILIAYLTATSPAYRNLPYRRYFYQNVYEELRGRPSIKCVSCLLAGLD